jgi:hypothetical protein
MISSEPTRLGCPSMKTTSDLVASKAFVDLVALGSSSTDVLPPIRVYAFHDYVLCLLLTLFMHSIDDFYDDELDISHVASFFMVTTWIHTHLLRGCKTRYHTNHCNNIVDFYAYHYQY